MAANVGPEPSDYDLKIDTQVEKFVETKQKLTYFLVTASVVVIAFLVNFVVEHRDEVDHLVWLVIPSAICGLLAAGCSLFNLHLELRSYQLHLKYRYERKTWNTLTPGEQRRWDRVNWWAAFFLRGAFALLFAEIGVAVALFILFFR